MHLYEVPLAFALAGLALYVVLGGADFGAGFWQLTAGRMFLAVHPTNRPNYGADVDSFLAASPAFAASSLPSPGP